jgi:hypothetical protein
MKVYLECKTVGIIILQIIFCGSINELCPTKIYNYSSMQIKDANKMSLWSIDNNDNINQKSLFAFSYAMKKIWEHQNPKNCSEAKFLISPGRGGQGFGSIIHSHGDQLAFAMNLGRILIRHPVEESVWEFNNSFCKKQKLTNYECYYEPYSSCTLNDKKKKKN